MSTKTNIKFVCHLCDDRGRCCTLLFEDCNEVAVPTCCPYVGNPEWHVVVEETEDNASGN